MKKRLSLVAMLSVLGTTNGKELGTFLGIHFGCSPKAVQKFLNQKPKHTKTLDGRKIHVYLGNHRLKGAIATSYIFVGDRLTSITTGFHGKKAEDLYDILLKKVERHYDEMTPKLKFGGKGASCLCPPLSISLEYNRNPFGADITTITVVNITLALEWGEAQEKKKADALGDF